MTALTVHLEDDLLRRTREIAEARSSSVDDVVAEALQQVSARWSPGRSEGEQDPAKRQRLQAALLRFSNFDTGGPYSRKELNER